MGVVRERLRIGNFNDMMQQEQSDGSVLVIMTKREDPHVYKMLVRDLYTPQEVVLKEWIE